MPRYKIIYESEETVMGHLPKSDEWVQYTGLLKIRDGGKTPVTIDMTFDPPSPIGLNMPETHSIKAGTITEAYAKVVRFLSRYHHHLHRRHPGIHYRATLPVDRTYREICQ